MKCPVCQASNPDDASSCNTCNSDLEAFAQIKFLDDQIKTKTRAVMLISILLGVLVLAGGAFFVNMNSAPAPVDNSGELNKLEDQVKDLNTQLEAAQENLKMLQEAPVEESQEESAEETTDSEPVSDAKSHIVKEGESLWSISADHYGDGNMYPKIAAQNNITDPDLIPVGLNLIL